MRKVRTIAIGLATTLIAPIGSNGTGTMQPQAAHVDRALFADAHGRYADLRAADTRALDAVLKLKTTAKTRID